MATKALRNSAYDARPNFTARTKGKNNAPTFKGNLTGPPGIPEKDGHGMFMDETQERSYALNTSLMHEIGDRAAHSNMDCTPIRSMSGPHGDGVFAARPDRGTTYALGWQLQPAHPFHPLSTMAYMRKPMENLGNIDPAQRPLFIDSYAGDQSRVVRDLR